MSLFKDSVDQFIQDQKEAAARYESRRRKKVLKFCVDRLVNVYGEDENTDFIANAYQFIEDMD